MAIRLSQEISLSPKYLQRLEKILSVSIFNKPIAVRWFYMFGNVWWYAPWLSISRNRSLNQTSKA